MARRRFAKNVTGDCLRQGDVQQHDRHYTDVNGDVVCVGSRRATRGLRGRGRGTRSLLSEPRENVCRLRPASSAEGNGSPRSWAGYRIGPRKCTITGLCSSAVSRRSRALKTSPRCRTNGCRPQRAVSEPVLVTWQGQGWGSDRTRSSIVLSATARLVGGKPAVHAEWSSSMRIRWRNLELPEPCRARSGNDHGDLRTVRR